jgi:nucleoside-diphosphate-sugar epimerase
MRVFVAGATGAIGRRLVPQLIAQGHDVSGMTRTAQGAELLRSLGAQPYQADAFAGKAVRAAVSHARPDAIIHQLTDLSGSDFAANAALRVNGTRNLVDAAHAAGVPRMIAQSISWAYRPGDVPADEDVPLDLEAGGSRALTVRAVASLETAVAEVHEWVVLRYGLLYGPGTWYAPDGARADDARAGRLLAADDVSSFVHVDDAARAAVAALHWPSGAVNVCDDEPAAGRDWVPAFCAAVGAAWVGGPKSTGGPAWARGALNQRARALGWTPEHTTWRTGFAQQERSLT